MIQQIYHFFVFILIFLICFGNSSNNINIVKEDSSFYQVLDSGDNSDSNQFYPIEKDATCETLITDNNICTKYLGYNRIYASSTQQSQISAATSASLYIDQIIQYGSQECNQENVFRTICTYLFPQCFTYQEISGNKEFNVAIRTCYEECYQSVEWCSYSYKFDCNQNLNGYNVPLFPVNSTKYSFESYGYQNIDLKCANPFSSSSSSSSNNNNSSSNESPTPTPTPTPLQPEKTQHSKFIKFIISFAIIFPILTIIALIIYNFNRGKLTKKKFGQIEYEDDEYINNNSNNNITPTGNSIVNEYTPLMGH